MKILVATEVIHPGGAETFLLRLSQALHKKGHEVLIFNLREDICHKTLKQTIAPDVSHRSTQNRWGALPRYADALFLKMNCPVSLHDYLAARSLQKLIDTFQPDIIHSHLFKTDVLCCAVAEKNNIPVVATMHGDYAMYYGNREKGINIRLPAFRKKLRQVLTQLRHIVCISGEQEDFFAGKMQSFMNHTLNFSKIYNGYSVPETPSAKVARTGLNIPENAFVFGMVARGIPSKGWEELITAFSRVKNDQCYLLLVGGSDYVDQLKEKHKTDKQIIFAGTVTNPLEWIKCFDVGILPSYFGSESLPTVIMEYLYCGKPVIATRIGEIPQMIRKDHHTAGMLVNITDGRTNIIQLQEAMLQLYKDHEHYGKLQKAAAPCFKQFDMDRCVAAYESIYKQYTT